jgi:hypothetical protein
MGKNKVILSKREREYQKRQKKMEKALKKKNKEEVKSKDDLEEKVLTLKEIRAKEEEDRS